MGDFHQQALDIFRLQAAENALYAAYINSLSVVPGSVFALKDIPFLPIGFFKSHRIQTGSFEPELCFESSGTTGAFTSRHCIKTVGDYLGNAEAGFREFYGDPSSWCILALLPSYLERGHSSLVAMADHLIRKSRHAESGFFLQDTERLFAVLSKLEASGQPTLLMGVTFALVDFAEQFSMKLQHTVVMETGGMKGRKREMTRRELHSLLKEKLGVQRVHAEYGMTELQSQAYSEGDGLFRCASTMKILLRAADDPFDIWGEEDGVSKTGVINVVDLANRDTVSFIATDDIGRFHEDGSFEVLGRMDNAEARGCSMLAV